MILNIIFPSSHSTETNLLIETVISVAFFVIPVIMEMAMTHDVGTLAAVAGATAGAATARRSQAPYYRSPRSTVSTFDAASYMNHLRAPVPSRIPASHGAGVGIHIHYQGQCPHDVAHGSSYPGDILNSHSEGYGYPQDHHNPLYPYYEGSPSSPCGCPRCYWRDFVS